jgi:hypothetical protein
MALTPLWRIYNTSGKYYLLLGTVEAANVDEAMEKALKGTWRNYYATEADRPTTSANLAVHY